MLRPTNEWPGIQGDRFRIFKLKNRAFFKIWGGRRADRTGGRRGSGAVFRARNIQELGPKLNLKMAPKWRQTGFLNQGIGAKGMVTAIGPNPISWDAGLFLGRVSPRRGQLEVVSMSSADFQIRKRPFAERTDGLGARPY